MNKSIAKPFSLYDSIWLTGQIRPVCVNKNTATITSSTSTTSTSTTTTTTTTTTIKANVIDIERVGSSNIYWDKILHYDKHVEYACNYLIQ